MNSPLILVVDDDPDILRILKDNLEWDGYAVLTAGGGQEALSVLDRQKPDLVILDLSLPDIDGIRVCRMIRTKSDTHIIILTARDRVPDKILGLESGADDYVVKPFDYMELAARIKAQLRRTRTASDRPNALVFGSLSIDTEKNAVFKKGVRLNLTLREFKLVLLLAENQGKVMSRPLIRDLLWPEKDLYQDSRAIDVHIQHLRSKIEDNPSEPKIITTVQGVGYMFVSPEPLELSPS